MRMDASIALDRLRFAEWKLQERQPDVEKRERYLRGDQDLPYAPKGVTDEYESLRKQSIANWLELWARSPVQRLRMDGLRTGLKDVGDEPADKVIWRDFFQANQWDQRQTRPYLSMIVHGRGLVSVWPNAKNKARPIIRPESFAITHLEMDPDDPMTPLWAAKVYEVQDTTPAASGLVLPAGVTRPRKTVGVYFDAEGMVRFEKGGQYGDWELVKESSHPMGEVPFAPFDYRASDTGEPFTAMDHMIQQQDALNSIRFNTLLAMQFSAFRQRVVSGFDPRVRDESGEVVYRKDDNGALLLDQQGRPQPLLNSPGRIGVDRLLAFPDVATKVYDLPESNLKNYVEVHENFLVNFFATGQIPPQYLLTRMANLSGDALAGAESTFASLIAEIQIAAGEGNEKVAELAWKASGRDEEWDPTAECLWADAEARSFSQIVDAITKLIAVDFPRRGAYEMLPGATAQKVDQWMMQAEDEAFANRLGMIERELTPVPTQLEE